MKQQFECDWPPVFIIGAPRSGTTLLYQMLMTTFQFSYIPNISNRWYMCPISAAASGLKICRQYESSFSSTHGYEKGCMAPSEAGNVWNRWFPHEKQEGFNYTPAGWLKESAIKDIYHLVANLERLFQAPFATKNVKMSVRIAALREIFPKAMFVLIKRDIRDVVYSNIIMRRKRNVAWASVMPKEIEQIKELPELEQVCRQIYYVDKNIAKDLALYPKNVAYHLDYARLCDEPALVLEDIRIIAELNGIILHPTGAPIPSHFKVSKPKIDEWITKSELDQINRILESLGNVI